MISLDGAQTTLLDSTVRGVATLIELEFLSGTQRYTTWNVDLLVSPNTYTAVGNLVTLGIINETEGPDASKLTIRLNVTNAALLALAAGPATEYRGRKINIYQQFLGPTFQQVGTPKMRWSGLMSKVQVPRDAPKDGPGSGAIELICTRSGMARFRNTSGLRLTHAQHIARYPGDLGLSMMQDLIERPVQWLSKRFQEQT